MGNFESENRSSFLYFLRKFQTFRTMQALVAGLILKDIISKERKIFPPKQKRLKGLQALMTIMSQKRLFTVCTVFTVSRGNQILCAVQYKVSFKRISCCLSPYIGLIFVINAEPEALIHSNGCLLDLQANTRLRRICLAMVNTLAYNAAGLITNVKRLNITVDSASSSISYP
jgi:hypothetical protein